MTTRCLLLTTPGSAAQEAEVVGAGSCLSGECHASERTWWRDEDGSADGYSHEHEIAWSRSQGQPPPPRKRLEDFRWRPWIDIKGRWIGTQLREKCRRGHRINVNRGDLRQLVEEANPEQTLYLG